MAPENWRQLLLHKGGFSRFSWSQDFGAKMTQFPPKSTITKQVAIQTKLMNIQYQNVNIIVYIWAPKLAIIKIGGCTWPVMAGHLKAFFNTLRLGDPYMREWTGSTLVQAAPTITALAITPSHQQNTHDFADGRKNMNDIFNNYVCSASHMRLGLHFQNV